MKYVVSIKFKKFIIRLKIIRPYILIKSSNFVRTRLIHSIVIINFTRLIKFKFMLNLLFEIGTYIFGLQKFRIRVYLVFIYVCTCALEIFRIRAPLICTQGIIIICIIIIKNLKLDIFLILII